MSSQPPVNASTADSSQRESLCACPPLRRPATSSLPPSLSNDLFVGERDEAKASGDAINWLEYGYQTLIARIDPQLSEAEQGRQRALALVSAVTAAFPAGRSSACTGEVVQRRNMSVYADLDCLNGDRDSLTRRSVVGTGEDATLPRHMRAPIDVGLTTMQAALADDGTGKGFLHLFVLLAPAPGSLVSGSENSIRELASLALATTTVWAANYTRRQVWQRGIPAHQMRDLDVTGFVFDEARAILLTMATPDLMQPGQPQLPKAHASAIFNWRDDVYERKRLLRHLFWELLVWSRYDTTGESMGAPDPREYPAPWFHYVRRYRPDYPDLTPAAVVTNDENTGFFWAFMGLMDDLPPIHSLPLPMQLDLFIALGPDGTTQSGDAIKHLENGYQTLLTRIDPQLPEAEAGRQRALALITAVTAACSDPSGHTARIVQRTGVAIYADLDSVNLCRDSDRRDVVVFGNERFVRTPLSVALTTTEAALADDGTGRGFLHFYAQLIEPGLLPDDSLRTGSRHISVNALRATTVWAANYTRRQVWEKGIAKEKCRDLDVSVFIFDEARCVMVRLATPDLMQPGKPQRPQLRVSHTFRWRDNVYERKRLLRVLFCECLRWWKHDSTGEPVTDIVDARSYVAPWFDMVCRHRPAYPLS